MYMEMAWAALVHKRLRRRPSESARKTRNTKQPTVLTIPYTPVANSWTEVPVIPRPAKICGA
jgi:hypothetical protein